MSHTISRKRLLEFLQKDGDITYLIPYKRQVELKRNLMSNQSKWSNITQLPEYILDIYDRKLRDDCIVRDELFIHPPETGPNIVFEASQIATTVRIDSDKSTRGLHHYRRALAIVAYYAGFEGNRIKPENIGGKYHFSDEEWILIGISTRYCLMPPKYIKKVYLLTQMSVHNNETASDKSFLRTFVDNLCFQANLPEWVVMLRLHEHAIASNEFSDVISRRPIDNLVERYRKRENYKDVLI